MSSRLMRLVEVVDGKDRLLGYGHHVDDEMVFVPPGGSFNLADHSTCSLVRASQYREHHVDRNDWICVVTNGIYRMLDGSEITERREYVSYVGAGLSSIDGPAVLAYDARLPIKTEQQLNTCIAALRQYGVPENDPLLRYLEGDLWPQLR